MTDSTINELQNATRAETGLKAGPLVQKQAQSFAADYWNLAAQRLPDERETCIVIDSEGAFYVAYFIYEDSSWHLDWNEDYEVTITHWAYVYPPTAQPAPAAKEG